MNYSELYKKSLLSDVVPFWEKHSIDREFGGYLTCLNQNGSVYDTDKFMWLQGRQAWLFSMLFNKVKKNEKWLEISKSGIEFLIRYGTDSNGNFYFSLTRDGRPLVKPYNIFSDCFAAMAFAQYAKASGDMGISRLAKKTYLNILKRKDNPKGIYKKTTENVTLKSFALPMILSNLVLELEDILDKSEVEGMIDHSVNEVMNVFLQKESGLVHEFVQLDGSLHDSFDGRLINPGHGLEAMWFIIDIGVRRKDKELIQKASETAIKLLEYSWDEKYGGIFYFMDSKGHPPQQLEHDQKLWWVHLEALVVLIKSYKHCPSNKIFDWYQKVHDYTWSHFPDKKHGEWFGYLNRQGQPHLSLKGGKWKGCFHTPRALYQCWDTLKKIEAVSKNKKPI